MKKIIGLTGIAGSGKDTAAILISKQYHDDQQAIVEIMAFAKPLKDACKLLFNFSNEQLYDPIKKEEIDEVWDKSPRKILQWLGTDILREHINKEFFIINMKQRIEESKTEYIVISDVRFSNESEMIRKLGGKIIKIIRPDAITTDHSSHITEQGIPDDLVDEILINDGSIEDLDKKLKQLINKFKSS